MANYLIERYGYRYSIDVDDAVMEAHYKRGELVEQGMLTWIVDNVPHGGVFVDCGANVGEHSLVFATACKADTVMAFEPAPVNYRKLSNNAGDLANAMLFRLGVGQGPRLTGIAPTAQGRNSQWALTPATHSNVAVVSLDAIVPQDGVRLLKIDVEGMEWDVLQGARLLIHRSKPEIFVEIWKQADLNMIAEWLAIDGYELIECWGEAPTFHFSASGRYAVTYKPRQLQ